jgi:hypothetical protein
LRIAESARIDANRAVDNAAVQQAASVADMRAGTLADQVIKSAEALRIQVQDAAAAAATALAAALSPIQTDVADLRKAQYEQQGQKAQVTETRSKGASTGLWIGLVIAAFAAFLTVVMIVVIVAIATKGFTALLFLIPLRRRYRARLLRDVSDSDADSVPLVLTEHEHL